MCGIPPAGRRVPAIKHALHSSDAPKIVQYCNGDQQLYASTLDASRDRIRFGGMADQSINYTVQVCVIKPSPKAEAGDLLVDGMTVTTTTTMCRAVGRSSEYIRRCVCLCMCVRNAGTAATAAAAALTSVVTPQVPQGMKMLAFIQGQGRGRAFGIRLWIMTTHPPPGHTANWTRENRRSSAELCAVRNSFD